MTAAPPDIALIIPARNEELSLPGVLGNVPHEITRVVVVDNGSTDATAQVAAAYGAQVVTEPVAGYGRACLAGLASLRNDPPDIVAFVDADGSDELSRLPDLIAPVAAGEQDLVLGRRIPVDRDGAQFSAALRAPAGHRADPPVLEAPLPRPGTDAGYQLDGAGTAGI